ncbi:tetratricopeptide repeat protein [Sphaerisporangium aureirubrum]|uniref:Transcriptional regulator n=1 Tax=Sphaerisporangium aureirubrum TaxID=1544736 RepID=A0ABW1NFT2_9ACTN
MRREPNHLLRHLIAEAGISHKGLARRLNDLGGAHGLAGLTYDHSSVLRWMAGQRPRDPVPELLAEIFALRLGRPVTPEDLGMAGGATPLDLGQRFSDAWQEGVQIVTALWRADMERRRFLLDSAFTVGAGSAGALRWLTSPPGGFPEAEGPRRVGAPDIAAIREVTRSFGELDNRFGGGRVRAAVVRYLDSAVAPLLKDGVYGEATGRALASAAAEATRLAGWMAYDLEQHGLAQRHLIQALSLARGAGDEGLGGEVLAGLAHQAIYIGQPRHALDLARAAQLSARSAAVPSLLAEAYVMEAHAHAALSDGSACALALHQADLAFDRRRPEEEPEWIRYFDEAYLAAKYAHCFRDLGDGTQAVRYARRSLDMDGRFVRGRMFNLSLLASAHALCGELDEACLAGASALDLATGLQSARTRSYVADLRRRLTPLSAEPVVAALVERAGQLAPAA